MQLCVVRAVCNQNEGIGELYTGSERENYTSILLSKRKTSFHAKFILGSWAMWGIAQW